jgi:Carboxypeptidase regulatory-like domain
MTRQHGWQTFCCRVAFTCLFTGIAATALAQFDRGQISGVIKDESGAVVPGATVTATQIQTQVVKSTVTDSSGFYTFATLPSGRYNLAAELQGFKKSVKEGVQLDAAGSLTVDFALSTGALTESVTVTAEQTLLQSDVALRKTVESKDIEQLSFSGRNPIGVAGLKPGVIGGSFNNYNFSDLGNGGFNINGSRTDENNITVDGATAIRTRSNGAIVGIQNVDALQEVQVLTGDYMPEYGRVSGGQIRMVTKSGSNRFSGSGSYYYRDDKLQANTWARNRSPNSFENSGAAPFDYKQYAYSVGGPVPFSQAMKDKLFFFAAQEWVNYFAIQTNTATVPTAKMRAGDFSELLAANNGFYSGARVINDPQTGQPFTSNIIPTNRLSQVGLSLLRAYPLPTEGFRQGAANAILSSENPQDQRKDNIRLDYRLNAKNQVTYRYGKYNWKAIDAFRGTFPLARTQWDRPNTNQTASWTSSLTNKLFNEFSFTYSLDEVFIGIYQGTDSFKRSKYGINYPYIFPDNKAIADRIPTITIDQFTEIDGSPYPSSSRGPIYTFNQAMTYLKGRHTIKGGVLFEYSGEDDFDQINVSAVGDFTNNQNGRFVFRNAGNTGAGIANAAMGLFSSYAEIGRRALTRWRALSTDVFVQDSWRPTSQLTVEGGVRWAYWPPWYALENNAASFDPRYYSTTNQAVIDRTTGQIVSGPRYNGIVLPGDGFTSSASNLPEYNDPVVKALFVGVPRGFSETHKNVFEPRVGVSYAVNEKTLVKASTGVFHTRITLNDSTLLGGNAPFQPQVLIGAGQADALGSLNASALTLAMTSVDPVFKHPTAYMWSAGIQREIPLNFIVDVTYVGRRGLYLQRERDLNQMPAGTVQANPGVATAALRPYKGYSQIRFSENAGYSKYNSLQISAERRYKNGFRFSAAYTLGHSEDNASGKRDILFNGFDDTGYWGNSSFDRKHVFVFSYIYDLPFYKEQKGAIGKTLGGWQISGSTFMRSGTPLWVTESADIAGTGDSFASPWNINGDPKGNANEQFSAGNGNDENYWFDKTVFTRPSAGTFGNNPRNNIYNPGQYQWDIAVFKNVTVANSRNIQFRAEIFNFLNHANWNGAEGNPTNAQFGRITSKDGSRRDIQLSLRFLF